MKGDRGGVLFLVWSVFLPKPGKAVFAFSCQARFSKKTVITFFSHSEGWGSIKSRTLAGLRYWAWSRSRLTSG